MNDNSVVKQRDPGLGFYNRAAAAMRPQYDQTARNSRLFAFPNFIQREQNVRRDPEITTGQVVRLWYCAPGIVIYGILGIN